ncbi:hypothetical protein QNI19_13470 [Cytophagaceae bacterium DM2B3-1]|uniref:Lipoprotein n=1 Tax=Xanthocytophaga flava TaxID=3048013 RepID=A0ABT7CJR2_9BACT|nr:hypothetical protein [Xanthocytophaga flavus]MDJ1467869.1 hypothetical protein [Xanthocytophaga flavus]MDJ1493947.1 hypothetical protein [Xanthocytophaga flavus]
MKKKLIQALILGLALTTIACNHSVDDIGIVRDPEISVDINGKAWQSRNTFVVGLEKAIVYKSETDTAGLLYYTYRMILNGQNEAGLNRKLTIRFAVQQPDQLKGHYSTQFSEYGKIIEAEVLDQVSKDEYTSYQLITPDSTTFLQIDRQSTDKNLIAGTFAFHLVNTQDSTQVLEGTNGIFKDITYQKWQNSNL